MNEKITNLFHNAIAEAKTISDPKTRDYLLYEIAGSMINAGLNEEAKTLRSEIPTPDPLNPKKRLFRDLLEGEQYERAVEYAQSTFKDPSERNDAFLDIMREMIFADSCEPARPIADEVVNCANPKEKYENILTRVASLLIDLSEIQTAIDLTRHISFVPYRIDVYLKAASQQAMEDGPITAKPYLDLALKSAMEEIAPGKSDSSTLAKIAGAYAKLRFFAEARRIAENITDIRDKTEAWIKIATEITRFRCRNLTILKDCLKARELIEQITNPFEKAEMIVRTIEFSTFRAEKKKILDEALGVISTTPDILRTKNERGYALYHVSMELARLGFFEESVAILPLVKDRGIHNILSDNIEHNLVSGGLFEEALKVLREDDLSESDREHRLSMIAYNMLDYTELDEVLKLLDIAETQRGRALVLAAVAEYLADKENESLL